jgi:hypothetical protein
MRRKIAVLLIIGWVILSGFDVLEDLKSRSASYVAGRGALANNIVESAHRVTPDYFDLLSSIVFSPALQPVAIFLGLLSVAQALSQVSDLAAASFPEKFVSQFCRILALTNCLGCVRKSRSRRSIVLCVGGPGS